MVEKSLTLKDKINSEKVSIEKLLPEHCNVDRFIKSALMVIYNNERLQKCSGPSITGRNLLSGRTRP